MFASIVASTYCFAGNVGIFFKHATLKHTAIEIYIKKKG